MSNDREVTMHKQQIVLCTPHLVCQRWFLFIYCAFDWSAVKA